jgi:hypothetical protein
MLGHLACQTTRYRKGSENWAKLSHARFQVFAVKQYPGHTPRQTHMGPLGVGHGVRRFGRGTRLGRTRFNALWGDLKYPAGFTHFDYVNPQAPKGGELRLVSNVRSSTFDKYNPFTIKGSAPAYLSGLMFDRC